MSNDMNDVKLEHREEFEAWATKHGLKGGNTFGTQIEHYGIKLSKPEYSSSWMQGVYEAFLSLKTQVDSSVPENEIHFKIDNKVVGKITNLETFIKEKSYSLPFTEQDLTEAYNLGRQEVIDELITKIIGYPVGGVVQGMVSENVLKEYKKELTKKKK